MGELANRLPFFCAWAGHNTANRHRAPAQGIFCLLRSWR